MEDFSFWNTSIFTNILTLILIVFCFYYTLSFFELLKGDEGKAIKKAKRSAVICFALALAVPALTSVYYLVLMNINR